MMKLPRHSEDWTSRPDVQLQGVPPRLRLEDLLDVGFALRVRECTDLSLTTPEIIQDYYCDLSSNINRLPYKKGPHTFRRNSYEYSYEHDKVISGCGRMQLLGWPRSMIPSTFNDGDYRT